MFRTALSQWVSYNQSPCVLYTSTIKFKKKLLILNYYNLLNYEL